MLRELARNPHRTGEIHSPYLSLLRSHASNPVWPKLHAVNMNYGKEQTTIVSHQMLSGNWKFWEPKIWWELSWTKTATPHLLLLNPCHREKLTVPDTVFLAEMSLTVQSFSSFLTTKSLDRTRPLFSPLGQLITSPLSYSATITLTPRLSTLVLRAPVRETCKESAIGLRKVACWN